MSFSAFDHACMAEALRLARRGLNTTHPNPRVGCVIAAGGEVVGRGWHERAGGPHAEVGALGEAGAAATGATAYVTLEPCGHHGRTPPCAEALVAAGIARVVIAAGDPNPEVDGNGEARLRAAGVAVEAGLMAAEAEALNAGFFKRMRSGRPWVRVKLAQSLDGRTALADGESRWISCAEARRDVQRWRARADCILTGVGTVLADDPSLTVRDEPMPAQPLRVVVDGHWRTPADAKILSLPGRVLIAGRKDIERPGALAGRDAGAGADTAVECVPLPARDARVDLDALLDALGERQINEVQVEAGATLCGALLEAGHVDELLLYLAPSVLGDTARGAFRIGPLAEMEARIRFEWLETGHVGSNLVARLKPVAGAH